MNKGSAIFVKIEDEEYSRQPSSDEPKGYTCWRWYEAEFDDKPNAVGAHRITFWPLPAYGLRIGSVVREWPADARVVRRVKELRQCEEWAARARRNEPRMQFPLLASGGWDGDGAERGIGRDDGTRLRPAAHPFGRGMGNVASSSARGGPRGQ